MPSTPTIVAICGVKNSGKTTMMVKLISALSQKGYQVASIKHDAHSFDADTPGKDSYRHKAAGAFASFVYDNEKVQMVRSDHVDLPWLIAQLPEADIILLEGAKDVPYPKIEIVRAGNSTAPVRPVKELLAVASDLPLSYPRTPVLHINDVQGLCQLIITQIP